MSFRPLVSSSNWEPLVASMSGIGAGRWPEGGDSE